MSEWIDFRALRRDLDLEKVLVAYGVRLNIRDTPRGRQHSGPCPLNTCKGKPSLKPTFSANVTEGIWQCFGCGSHGNTLDFVLLREGLSLLKGADVRKGAFIARRKFLGRATDEKPKEPEGRGTEATSVVEDAFTQTVVNDPLDFALKSLDSSHAWFKANGLLPETVKHFGLGASSRRKLKGRIAVPLQDEAGLLLGYAGLALEEKANGKDPRYLFPEPRVRNGIRYVLDRGKFLYHEHAVKGPVNRLLVVSDMETVWWLWQHGYGHVVSTMGNSCEDAQAKRALSLLSPSGIIAVLAQQSEDGSRFAREVMARCGRACAVRWYATDTAPASLGATALQSLLGLAETAVS